MFKVGYVSSVDGLKEAQTIMDRIYNENPKHWPYGLTPGHFDGGVYLIREKRSNAPIGFAGWQERIQPDFWQHEKVGYYSIGILPEFRRNRFAKEAVSKLISMKSASVDRVEALIVSSNSPSIELAKSLGVDTLIKRASNYAYWQQAKARFGFA